MATPAPPAVSRSRAARLMRLMAVAARAPFTPNLIPKVWSLYRSAGLQGVAWGLRRQSGEGGTYADWVRTFDTVTDTSRTRIRAQLAQFADPPTISVLMPVYNPNPAWLEAAIHSVQSQLYPHWELCIADDASSDPQVRRVLQEAAARDPRVKVVFRQVNGHISAASNSALSLVGGAWTALMDHDDLLAEDALFHVAEAIHQNPDVRLIYSDEDKADDDGGRFDPYFKCDWNLDLFRSHNMFGHLGVIATELVHEVGAFREGLEGSQDWDLVLRCVERVRPDQIFHIPRVLYHWRVHARSTAKSLGAKPYAVAAAERALNDHFERLGVRARAEHEGQGYRIRYATPDPAPLVTIIVPTRNAHELVRTCLSSVTRLTDYPKFEILLVDNGSDDPEALRAYEALARGDTRIRVLRDDREFNFSALNNAAAREARGEFLVLMNNDIEVLSPGWLAEMLSLGAQPGVGAVGARLWYPNRTLQHGGVFLSSRFIAGHAHKQLPRGLRGYAHRAALTQDFSALTGACLLVSKATYDRFGGLDEAALKIAFNDVDFCLRLAAAGLRNVWTPYAELIHHESATRGREDVDPARLARFEAERQVMRERWATWLEHDPAYSPNLTDAREDFSYAWPPRVAPR